VHSGWARSLRSHGLTRLASAPPGVVSLTYFRFPPAPAPHLWPAPGPLPSVAAGRPPFVRPDGQTLELTVDNAYHPPSGHGSGPVELVELWAGPIGPLEVQLAHDDGYAGVVGESGSGSVNLIVGLPSVIEVTHVLGRIATTTGGGDPPLPADEASSSTLAMSTLGPTDADVFQHAEAQLSAGPSTAFDGHEGPTAALDGLQAVAAAMASIQQQEQEAQQQQQQQQDGQSGSNELGSLVDPTFRSLIGVAGADASGLEERLAAFAQQQAHYPPPPPPPQQQQQQQQQQQMADAHEPVAAFDHHHHPVYQPGSPSPPTPAVYPPTAAGVGPGSSSFTLPVIFVRRSQADGVVRSVPLPSVAESDD
jgi:hypothetical protein